MRKPHLKNCALTDIVDWTIKYKQLIELLNNLDSKTHQNNLKSYNNYM